MSLNLTGNVDSIGDWMTGRSQTHEHDKKNERRALSKNAFRIGGCGRRSSERAEHSDPCLGKNKAGSLRPHETKWGGGLNFKKKRGVRQSS